MSEDKLDRRQMLAASAAICSLPLLPAPILELQDSESAPKMPEYPDLFSEKIVVTFDAARELRVNKMLVMEQVYQRERKFPALILFEYRDLASPPHNRFLTLENAEEAYRSLMSCYGHSSVDTALMGHIPVGKIFDRSRFSGAEAIEARDGKVHHGMYESLFEYIHRPMSEKDPSSRLCCRGTDMENHVMIIADVLPVSRFAIINIGREKKGQA